jgi:drug/metabolite transporter (DMT)-like permease
MAQWRPDRKLALTRKLSPKDRREDRPLLGIACVVGGMVLLVLSDASAKWLADTYPVTEVVVLRGLFIIVLLLIVGYRQGSLRIVNRWGHALRGFFAVSSSFLFVHGLVYLPLAEATAGAFAGPLFLTALAGPLLGEKVGVRRWMAVLLGFAGVLVMLRPSSAGMNWMILLPVSAACMGALRDVITRRISATDNATSLLLSANVATALAGALFAASWTMPSVSHLCILALSGLLVGAAHYLLIEAFRFAEAATVAPFRYSSIVWGVLFGFAFFGQLPSWWVVAGATLVIVSGLYIMHRERLRRRTQVR